MSPLSRDFVGDLRSRGGAVGSEAPEDDVLIGKTVDAHAALSSRLISGQAYTVHQL
jgi:hypothetical protein